MVRRIILYFVCAVILLLGLQQGCTCAQVVDPGGDEQVSSSDGTRQVQDGSVETKSSPEHVTSNENPLKEMSGSELVRDLNGTTTCPNPQDVYCEHCTIPMGSKENLILLHRHYLLTQEGSQFKLYNLKQGCQPQSFQWAGIEGILLSKADPDSYKVLLLGVGKATPGQSPPMRLAFFELEQPGQPLRELSLPKKSFYDASRSTLARYNRRGVLVFPVAGAPPSEVYVHFQMVGAVLKLMSIPKGHTIFRYGLFPAMFSDYEVYVLQVRSPRAFPLAIWSVKEQKIVHILSRPGFGVPLAVFASSKDIFTLDIDPQDRSKKVIASSPIRGGPSSTLSAPGCLSFFGDNVAGILFCLAKDAIYRFKLPTKASLPALQMNIVPRMLAYYSGKVYLTEQTKPQRLWKVDLLAPKPNMIQISMSLPASLFMTGPRFPQQRSKYTTPGPNYRSLRGVVNGKYRIGILNVQSDKLQFLKDDFPTPAAMGRQTEFWNFFPGSFTYLVEPLRGASPQYLASAFFIRNDTASIFHHETPIADLYSYRGGISVGAGTKKVQIIGQRRYLKGPPPTQKSEILVVSHKRYKVQKMKLDRTYRVYHSDSFFTLGPGSRKDPREIKVFRIAE